MLQKPLYKRYITAAAIVYLGSIPLAEAVSANALNAKIVAHFGKMLLNRSFRKWEYLLSAAYPAAQAVVFYVLPYYERHSEGAALL